MKKSKDMEKIGQMGRSLGQEAGKLYAAPLKGKVVKGSMAEEVKLGTKMAQDFKKNARGQV